MNIESGPIFRVSLSGTARGLGGGVITKNGEGFQTFLSEIGFMSLCVWKGVVNF